MASTATATVFPTGRRSPTGRTRTSRARRPTFRTRSWVAGLRAVRTGEAWRLRWRLPWPGLSDDGAASRHPRPDRRRRPVAARIGVARRLVHQYQGAVHRLGVLDLIGLWRDPHAYPRGQEPKRQRRINRRPRSVKSGLLRESAAASRAEPPKQPREPGTFVPTETRRMSF